MFEDLRQAWKEAVDNFWRELEEDDGVGAAGSEPHRQLAAMRRELGNADTELHDLETEIVRTRRAVSTERQEQETCRRRRTLAESIGDAETARLATTYADRAAERAAVLERKAEALEAERELRGRELGEMRSAVDAAAAALESQGAATGSMGPGAASAGSAPDPTGPLGTDWGLADEAGMAREKEFRRMRDEARERAAQERLDELKRRMK